MDELIQSLTSMAEFEKQSISREATKIAERSTEKLNNFISASGDAIIKFERLKKSSEQLNESIKSSEDEEFVKMANHMVHADRKLLKEARDYAKKYVDATGSAFKEEILRIFKVAFKGTRARNIEIHCPPNAGYHNNKITIGQDGFGLRPGVQSHPVSNFDEMTYIIGLKEEVIKGLKQNNMAKQAKMFRKFTDLLPEIEKGNIIGVPTVKKVVVPREDEDDVTDMPILVEKMFFLPDKKLSFPANTKYTLYYGDEAVYRIGRGKHKGLDGRDALVYMQVSPYMKKYVDEFVAKVKSSIEKSEVAIERLREEFGRQLLIEAI